MKWRVMGEEGEEVQSRATGAMTWCDTIQFNKQRVIIPRRKSTWDTHVRQTSAGRRAHDTGVKR